MKKGVILLLALSLFAVFLSVNFISAITCSVKASCDAGETRVMGLSAATNAHGQLASQSGYAQSLCCTGNQNTTCGAGNSNKIIGLSSSTNAHADIPTGTYTNPVCYGYLECDTTCDINYPIEILSLSSTTNAHIGAFADYTTKICCKDNSPFLNSCDLTDATWQQATVSAGLSIRMSVNGNDCVNQGVAEGIDFSIYKKAGNVFITAISGNYDYAEWTAVQGGPYYFDATAIGSGDSFSSLNGIGFDELTVTAEDPDLCKAVDICEDYADHSDYPEISCNSDPNVCDVAKDDPRIDPEASSFGCAWDSLGNTCNFTNYYGGSVCGNGVVENGEWCDDGNIVSRDGCSSTCTLEIPSSCNNNNQINTGEFCDGTDLNGEICRDLGFDGGVLSCNNCSFNVNQCMGPDIPDEQILCGNGYTLCRAADTFADYCYRGNACPADEMPLDDGFGICDLGDGCSNTFSCSDGEQDSCVEGSLCQGGMCSSGASVVPVTACEGGFNLCSNALGKYCYPEIGCPGTDQDIPNVCILPAVDQGGICMDNSSSFGKCTYSYISSGDNCDDGFLTYSWTSTWKGTGAQPPACTSGSATIECPAQIPLPLFTPANTIVTVLAIITIYLAMALVKKGHKKVHRKKKR
ncbi:MAG: hypothetical protein PHH00_01370 [Candidatus Nanoarchaeia archaeon]|nr:hypothetical protein [Candidatus Nanoarchaeia archaeon]